MFPVLVCCFGKEFPWMCLHSSVCIPSDISKKQLSSWASAQTASALESVLISGSWSPLDFGEEWMEVVVERLRNFAYLFITCNS